MPTTDVDFDTVSRAIHARRTHKAFTGAAVDRATVELILENARWAPNHRLSQPWRFHALDQAAIRRLMAFLVATPGIAAVPDPAKGSAKLAKLLDRLPSAGALVQVTWVRASDPRIDLEDHAAVAAAIQNALLAATALGIATYWSTSAALVHPDTLRWCGVDTATQGAIGCIWLGHAKEVPPIPPRRGLNEVLYWVEGT
ncbi:MAG: nitroreductase family protein [Planctomycetes bacterium]|nr:nitroreductase family protein [Planctomycetota bacterium]